MGLQQWLVKGRLLMGFLFLGMGNKLQVDLLSFPRLLVRSSVDWLMVGTGTSRASARSPRVEKPFSIAYGIVDAGWSVCLLNLKL